MARVHTAIARKDYPAQGIVKGDKYWYWTPYRAGKHMSKTQPKPSQTESNATRASFMALIETLESEIANANCIADINSALESAADEAEGIAEELREKASNIEDGFQHATEASDTFNEQADGVSEWADELRGAQAEDAEEPTEPEEPERSAFESDEAFETAKAEYATATETFKTDYDEWERAIEDAKSEAEGLVANVPEV